jgi:hypothetical protein
MGMDFEGELGGEERAFGYWVYAHEDMGQHGVVCKYLVILYGRSN